MICKYCGRQIPDGTLCSCQQAQQEAMNFNQYQQPPFQQMQSPFQGQTMQPPYGGQPQFYQQGQNMQPPYPQPQQNMAQAGMAVRPEAAPYINDFGNNKRVLRKGRVIMCILIGVFVIVLIAGIIGITSVIKNDKDKKAKSDPNYISSKISNLCSDTANKYVKAICESNGSEILEIIIPGSVMEMQNSAEIAEMSLETGQGCNAYIETISKELGHIDSMSIDVKKINKINNKEYDDQELMNSIDVYYKCLGVKVDIVYAVEVELTVKGTAKTDVQKGTMYMIQLDTHEILVYPDSGIGSDYRRYY